MKLGLREANQQFSKAIKAVRAGKDVILTDRGRPIAVIKPIKTEDVPETALRAMVRRGSHQAGGAEGANACASLASREG